MLGVDLVLGTDLALDCGQVATHLKGLPKKANLNEGHAKATRVYKARVASLTSERAKLRDRVRSMTEEVVKLKSDLKHITSVRAQAEGREDEARNSLRAAEVEVRDELRALQNDLLEAKDGLQPAQSELQMVRDELLTSQSELRGSKEELRAVRDELSDKTALLDGARREASKAISSTKHLTEECRGLRGDLHQQVTLVTQRDEVIGRLSDEAYTQWASRWLSFQRKAANVYPGLDFNFDIPSDEEAEESLFADYSGELDTPVEAHSPSSPSAPSSDV